VWSVELGVKPQKSHKQQRIMLNFTFHTPNFTLFSVYFHDFVRIILVKVLKQDLKYARDCT